MLSQGNPARPHGEAMIAEIEAAAGPYAATAPIVPLFHAILKVAGGAAEGTGEVGEPSTATAETPPSQAPCIDPSSVRLPTDSAEYR